MHVCMYVHVRIAYTHTYIHIHIHEYVHTYVHTCNYTYMHTYTYIQHHSKHKCDEAYLTYEISMSHAHTRTHAGCIKSGARQQHNKFKLKRDPWRRHDRPLLYSKLRSVTWLVFLWDMTISYVWHDSFAQPAYRDTCLLDLRWDCGRGKFGICVPWNVYTRIFVSATLFFFPLEVGERAREEGGNSLPLYTVHGQAH